MTSKKGTKEYVVRLPQEVGALLRGNGILGLTEINPHWYRWLTEEFLGNDDCPSFAAGSQYEHLHDGIDCCIIWDTRQVNLSRQHGWTFSLNDNEFPPHAPKERFAWRGFTSSEFQNVAPPHVMPSTRRYSIKLG